MEIEMRASVQGQMHRPKDEAPVGKQRNAITGPGPKGAQSTTAKPRGLSPPKRRLNVTPNNPVPVAFFLGGEGTEVGSLATAAAATNKTTHEDHGHSSDAGQHSVGSALSLVDGHLPGPSKVVVEAETDQGLVGLGESPSSDCAEVINKILGPRLIGFDALGITACEKVCVPETRVVQNTNDKLDLEIVWRDRDGAVGPARQDPESATVQTAGWGGAQADPIY